MGTTPNTPHYDQQAAIKEQNRVNLASAFQKYADVYGPNGGYTTYVDPTTGQLTVNKTLSDNSQLAFNRQGQVLGNYTGDGSDAANAYYRARMAYNEPLMQRQVVRGRTGLTVNGIPVGSSAWNERMGDIYDAQNQQLSALGSASLSAGQGYQGNILNQGALLGSQIVDPTMVAGQNGAGYKDMYDPEYANKIAKYKTLMSANHANQQILGGIGTVAGAIIGTYLGGNTATGAAIGGAAGNAIGAAADSQ